MNKSNTHKKPTSTEAEVGGLTKEAVATYSHSAGFVLVDTVIAYQPRPGAGVNGGNAIPAIIECSRFNA